jgi:hypothetical protein
METSPSVKQASAILAEFAKQEGLNVSPLWHQIAAARMLGLEDWVLLCKPNPRPAVVILHTSLREQDILITVSKLQDLVARVFGFQDWEAFAQSSPKSTNRQAT